jgi:hypothetical protein
MQNINIELLKDLAIPAGAIITWFTKDKILNALNIKKEKNDATSGNLENVQKALDLWQDMLNDAVRRHKVQVEELESIINRLRQDYDELTKILNEQKPIISDQKELIIRQAKSLEYYKNKYEKGSK